MEGKKTARQIQNYFGDFFSSITFNEFKKVGEHNDQPELRRYIAYSFFGEPTQDNNDSTCGYTKNQMEFVDPIYEKFLSFNKFSIRGNSICMSCLFVCVLKGEPKKDEDLTRYASIESENILISPVFKIRKCISRDDYTPSCCIYVDEHCREYSTWDNYLQNNKLPEGVMVYPKNGSYTNMRVGDESVLIDIGVALTPMAKKKWIKHVTNAGIGLGLGSLAVIGGTLFFPIAAPVLAVAAGAGAASGVIGLTTSSSKLIDRKKHCQKIDLQDAESRGCWLNIVGSTLGIASGGMTQYLSRFSQQGAVIGRGAQRICTGTFVASSLTNGIKIGDGLAQMVISYKDYGQKPTKLQILQLTSAALFFAHSTIKFKTAGMIIEDSQNSKISQQRTELRSNRHRKLFDKMAAETKRAAGDSYTGKAQIIRSMNHIEDKDMFFSNTVRMNKELNLNKIKISVGDDGAELNGNIPTQPKNLMNLTKAERSEVFSSIGPSKLEAKKISAVLQTQNNLSLSFLTIEAAKAFYLFFEANKDFEEYISNNLMDFSEECFLYLDKIALYLLRSLSPLQKESISSIYSDIKGVCLIFAHKKIKKFLSSMKQELIIELKSYFCGDKIISHKINPLIELLKVFINENLSSDNPIICCNICGGFRYSK